MVIKLEKYYCKTLNKTHIKKKLKDIGVNYV